MVTARSLGFALRVTQSETVQVHGSKMNKGRGTEARPHRISAAMFKLVLQIRSDSSGRPLMKAFAAALIAAAILYAVDSKYNDARYTRVVASAVGNVISR
jgi:hypothetical protein